MKSAIILSGQLRNFAECYPSLKEFILDHNDCHIYMHTYMDTDEDDLQEAIRLFQPQKLILEQPIKDFSICDQCGPDREPMYWMWRNIQVAFRLIPQYPPEWLPTYSCVVKARYDLKYTQPIVFADYNMEAINIPSGGNFLHGINDLFAFSAYENMAHYCSMIDVLDQYADAEGITCHPETLLRHHLKGKLVERPTFPIILRDIIMTDHYPNDPKD